MAQVAGLLASSLVGMVKDKLGSVIAEQASLFCNFGSDLEDMKDDLEFISAVLEDAEKQSVEKQAVRVCLKRLKDLAFDISDMLEDYQDMRDQAKAKMPRVLSCLPVACKKIVMANRMRSLTENLSKIRNDIDSFNFIKGRSSTHEQHYDRRETTSSFPEEPVIGRDGEKQEIINMLSAHTSNDEIVILPIYGLGGMGKTTLAQLVYNDSQFIKQYNKHVWVYVSQDFNLNKIGMDIISQLQPTQGGELNMGTQQMIECHLNERLRDQKVLVVLDDLWEEKKAELDKLRRMLHIKGSKVHVIVTTRKEEIAKEITMSERGYQLQTLEDGKCWGIIKRYSKFDLKYNQEKLEEIGLDIAKKCGGVALAAQVVGSMLQHIDDLSGWIKINRSDIWNRSPEDNDVLPSLKLSYEKMPPLLRLCFSYCALFPKGHNIVEDDLVQQWIAQGFIEQSKGKDCIQQLLGMSFLQVSKLPSTSQEQVVRYTMHDLVHDLARLTMVDELIDFNAPERNTLGRKYCRYLLLNYDQTTKLASISPSKIKALHFLDSGELDMQSGPLSFANCLRAFGFCECSGILCPASIGHLSQLRCLIAPRMQNESLPECITELGKLQYLNINGSSQISALPESIGKLGCLKYLYLSGCSSISKLPESFGNLMSMVHLDMSGCSGIRALPESMAELSKLQYLNINGSSLICALPESISKLGCLQYLCLSSCSGIRKLPESFGDLKCMVHLDMSGCSGLIELPNSIGNLTQLQHLELSGCFSVKELPESLCGLRKLQYLNLSSCSCSLAGLRGLTALKHLDLSFLGTHDYEDLLDDNFGTLTNLEHLNLSCNFGLKYLPESIGNLKRLHTLNLSSCSKLMSLPESIGTLGLKSLMLDRCSDALLDQASSLVNFLQTLPIFKVRACEYNGCSNLHLLEGINVSELRILSLENVRSLEEATKVKLMDKNNLTELSLSWSSSRVARFVDDQDLLGQLVPSSGLKTMHLQGYSCTSFPGWLMCIYSHLTNLVCIQLHDMRRCINLPPLGQLLHLEKLELHKLPRIHRIDGEFCGGKGAFRRLSSFTIMDMFGLEEWNTTYSVEDGVEEFMFPVLDKLEIRGCPGLRLKPCPPTFRECTISGSDQVISSLEEAVDKISQISLPSSRAIKLGLWMRPYRPCQSIRIFHHFPALQELTISNYGLTSLPESMRHLTSLASLKLDYCYTISALPEWLGDLSSLKSLVIKKCRSIKSLPACIQHLPKLQIQP